MKTFTEFNEPTTINETSAAEIAKFKRAIKIVADATDSTPEKVMTKLKAKDDWTWFLVKQADSKK